MLTCNFFLIYRVFEQYTRCPPADITYPTDLKLLNEAKELTEKTNKNFIEKRSGLGAHRPCCGRDKARASYLNVVKKNNHRRRNITAAIRLQL
jgi:hypothetical protein